MYKFWIFAWFYIVNTKSSHITNKFNPAVTAKGKPQPYSDSVEHLHEELAANFRSLG